MKRILAVLLTLVLAFSLFSCASGKTTASPVASSLPSTSAKPSAAAMPSSPASPSAAASPSAPVSPNAPASPSKAPSPSAAAASGAVSGHFNGPDWVPDKTPPHNAAGWYTDKVDWFARKPYKIAFLYSQAFALTDQMG